MIEKVKTDVIIIGAGAAGLFCAATAGQRGKHVLILEKSDKPGSKILISGGGRCNFTNLNTSADKFISGNPYFARNALARFDQHDFIDQMKRHNLGFNEKKLGQLFADEGAGAVLDMLLDDCADNGVHIRYNENILEITHDADGFHIHVQGEGDGMVYHAPKLVLATGGLSIPKMGATSFSYDIAKQFGLKVTKRYAALVPLTFGEGDLEFTKGLAGISIDCTATANETSFRENLLFTHRGLSGPAILQISSFWREGDDIQINLLPDVNAGAALIEAKNNTGKQYLKRWLQDRLPKRFVERLMTSKFENKILAECSNKNLLAVGEFLNKWTLTPTGSEGYRTAEVTLGGVDTAGLDPRTLEAKTCTGLYFIGECVDVTGWLGGYNFQWAWASAYGAGMHL
jgi:hypothetical protein